MGRLKVYAVQPPGLRNPPVFLHKSPICCNNLPLPSLFLLLVFHPGEWGRYLCQIVGSRVCNRKLSGEERRETSPRRDSDQLKPAKHIVQPPFPMRGYDRNDNAAGSCGTTVDNAASAE